MKIGMILEANFKGNSNIFFTGLLIRTVKVTVTSVVNFLITCLVAEI